MLIYSSVDFKQQPRVENAQVARGFVTRKWAETTWVETLIQLPLGIDLLETESVRHYVQMQDGTFHEFYGTKATYKPVYVAAAEFDPPATTPKFVLHLYDLPIKSVDQPEAKVHCPECQALTDRLKAHFVELHVCRDVKCQHVFVVNTEPVVTV